MPPILAARGAMGRISGSVLICGKVYHTAQDEEKPKKARPSPQPAP